MRTTDSGRLGLLGRTGRACHRHRWLTLAAWIAGVACLIVLWVQFGAPADNSFTGSDPGQAILDQHFPQRSGDTLTLAVRSTAPVTSAAVRSRVGQALVPLRQAAHVTAVTNPYTTPGQVSRDGHIAFASVQFSVPSTGISTGEANALMNDARAASGHGVTFSLGGDVVDQAETPYGGSSDGIGIAAAAVVLFIAFGSFLAMGLPVLTAVFGIGAGLSLIALLGHIFPAPSFSPIIASMIGLGVGVDYALFIVTRFREYLRGGAAPEEATVRAMRTSGRSVLTAGTTVVIGMMGLFVLRQPLMNGVAIAAAATVAMTVLAALTLLPALLGFTGTRLAKPSRLRIPGRRRPPKTLSEYEKGGLTAAGPGTAAAGRQLAEGAAGGGLPAGRGAAAGGRHPAERWAATISRHPVRSLLGAVAIIAVLAIPALSMTLNMPDESAQAAGTMGRASYQTMAEGFGPGFGAPLIVAATGRDPATGGAALERVLAGTPGVAHVTAPVVSADGKAVMLIAYPTTQEQDPATNALVNHLSDQVLPRAEGGLTAYLTGPNAGNVTFANTIAERMPWLIGVVIGLSTLLLLVVFRSIAVAIKAALMNLLSIAAAYGVLVAVTQWGWGHQLFGFSEPIPITTWVPMFLFVILFGLSMDYEVFLLARIKENYDRTGDNTASVARGLAQTARVISAAAAIMVVVFASFVLGADVSVKQIGLGLAVAVLVDATVVRLVLVPAIMELLGRANWWLPGWLARILPRSPAPEPEPAELEPPAGVAGVAPAVATRAATRAATR
ncbi:MAG TPA: MMPL family transporter [Streptosporangiaceae bacterium]|nr:MMPL family transporter [Streptosporangiaceae bacterium]